MIVVTVKKILNRDVVIDIIDSNNNACQNKYTVSLETASYFKHLKILPGSLSSNYIITLGCYCNNNFVAHQSKQMWKFLFWQIYWV